MKAKLIGNKGLAIGVVQVKQIACFKLECFFFYKEKTSRLFRYLKTQFEI